MESTISSSGSSSSSGTKRMYRLPLLLLVVGVLSLLLEVIDTAQLSTPTPLLPQEAAVAVSQEHLNSTARMNHVSSAHEPNDAPRSNRTKLYIHIGPHKTGSTFLQNLMATQHQLLEQDNIYYIGKINNGLDLPSSSMKDWVRPYREAQNPGEWSYSIKANKAKKDFLKRLQDGYISKNYSMIMSDEDLSKNPTKGAVVLNKTFAKLRNLVDVHIVMVYRPYFDHMLSGYHYGNLPKWFHRKAKWEQAAAISCFRDGILLQSVERYNLDDLYHAFAQFFPVHVVHLQDPSPYPDFGSSFLCRTLGEKSHVCRHLVQQALGGTTETRENADKAGSDAFLVDFEAMALYVKNLYFANGGRTLQRRLPQSIKRRDLVNTIRFLFRRWSKRRTPIVIPWEIRRLWLSPATKCSRSRPPSPIVLNGTSLWQFVVNRMGGNDRSIPMLCPTEEELSQLKNRTLQNERRFFPSRNDTSALQSLEQQFRAARDGLKFCNIDWTVMLEASEWKQFLECVVQKESLKECIF